MSAGALGPTETNGHSQLSIGSPPAILDKREMPPGHWVSAERRLASGDPARERVVLSILMPVYNEERTVEEAILGVLETQYPCAVELIVVDDGSTDGTPGVLTGITEPRMLVYRHATNMGKGAALRTAMSMATGTHAMPFDADLEYSADDIPKMLMPVLQNRSSVVYGARIFGFNTVYRSYRYALGNRMLTNLANILFDAWVADLHTCFKLIPLETLRSLDLREQGFGLDTEITALLLRLGIRPFEVPVSYYGRSHAQGKKITWRDGAECARVLLSVRFRPGSRLLVPGAQASALAPAEPGRASARPAPASQGSGKVVWQFMIVRSGRSGRRA